MKLRRHTRGVDPLEARALLQNGGVGCLGTVGADGTPYVVPLNYVLVGDRIYFHCAVTGHKLINIAHNSKVCFTVMGEHHVVPSRTQESCPSTTYYASVIVFGRAHIVQDDAERVAALQALVDHLIPGNSYVRLTPERLKGTAIVAIDVEEMTGKRHDATQ